MTRSEGDPFPEQIVSGGQTGVDRGALDAAIALGISHGGWCPRGRLAEDGTIPTRYELRETRSVKYSFRTRQNVIDSCGTLILCLGPLRGGTDLTYRLARRSAKPCLVVDLSEQPDPGDVRRWMRSHAVRILNVAGPRESSCPGIALQAQQFLQAVLVAPRDVSSG